MLYAPCRHQNHCQRRIAHPHTLPPAYLRTCLHEQPADQPTLLLRRISRSRAAEAGLANLSFSNNGTPEGALPEEPTFDLVLTTDAVHDMARPDLVAQQVCKVGIRCTAGSTAG